MKKYFYSYKAAEELINAMQYGVVGTLTKEGNKLIYDAFNDLKQQLEDTKLKNIKYKNRLKRVQKKG